MKIKKLELVGFKSFVDKTVLHFDNDVFAIVGPNGCGKSNIVDAIRWCMGEQSARHLRGRSMEDVIFSGSETRSAHDFAEVTLTFENDTPGELPLEYRDYAELAVTRRLHRTGESEYLVNKTTVRLRDVTDIFLGTGAGTKAYSIVEQGKVGLIVSAKPEDRRLLIEEAAGITKFKARKKQAEKKMELTQQNLLRVGDIVAEIERNITSLKRQAAKAERYVAYRDELEDLQLHEASHKFLELTGWIKLEGGAVESLSEDWERSRSELGAKEGELEARRLEVHAAEERLEVAQNESFAADSAVRAEEAAIERSKDRLVALSQREQQAEVERAQMAEQAAQLAAERDVVAGQVAVLAAEEGSEAETLAREEASLAGRVEQHAACSSRVAASRQIVARAQAEIASVEARLAGFERRQSEMAARKEKLGAERTALETSYRGLRVVTMPPPSSGGVALVETLGILDALYPTASDLPKDGPQSPAYLQSLTEAFKHAFADRARFLGDPDFVAVDVAKLTSAAYAHESRSSCGGSGRTSRDGLARSLPGYSGRREGRSMAAIGPRRHPTRAR